MDLQSIFDTFLGWSLLKPSEKLAYFQGVLFLIGGIFGLIFLAWRAFSTDRLARAALEQARIAEHNLSVANRQVEHQVKQIAYGRRQVEILAKNTELTARALTETAKNNLHGHLYESLKMLAVADSPLSRVVAVTVVADLTRKDPSTNFGALQALQLAARSWAPAKTVEAKQYEISCEAEGYDAKISFLNRLPFHYWQFMGPSLGHLAPATKIEQLSVAIKELSETDRKMVDALWSQYREMPTWKKLFFWYGLSQRQEIQAAVEAMSRIKIFNNDVLLPLSGICFDGCDFGARDMANAIMNGSSFRGCLCLGTNFSGVRAVECDFEGSMLVRTSFRDAVIVHSNFNHTNLEDADFTGADIVGCSFINCAGIVEKQFDGAIGKDAAKFYGSGEM